MSYTTLHMRVKPIFVIPEKIIVRSQNSISMKGLERLGKLAMSHFEIHYNKESIQDFPKLGRGIKEPRNSSNSVCWLLLLLNFYVFFCACLDHQMWQAGKNIELQRDNYCYGDYTYIQCCVGAQLPEATLFETPCAWQGVDGVPILLYKSSKQVGEPD